MQCKLSNNYTPMTKRRGLSEHNKAREYSFSGPVGVGVIGVGRFGENHARAYSESFLSSLVAVADLDDARARSVAAKYGAQTHYNDFRYLLDRSDIQAVSIATPAHAHTEPAIAAAEAGKDILLEKPIADSLEDAEAIVSAAETYGVRLLVGHMLRFEVNCASLHSAIAEGAMGRPIAVISRFNNPIEEARFVGKQISLVLHVLIHTIDISLWYLDSRPERVFCTAARGMVYEQTGLPDGCIVTMEFTSGSVAVAECFWSLPETYAKWSTPRSWVPRGSDIQLEVICTDGIMYLDAPTTGVRACDKEGWKFSQTTLRPTLHGELAGAFREEIQHFLRCCMHDQEPYVDGRDALAALEVALAAEMSLDTGGPVALPLDTL